MRLVPYSKSSFLLSGRNKPAGGVYGQCSSGRSRHVWFYWKDQLDGTRRKVSVRNCYICGKAKP